MFYRIMSSILITAALAGCNAQADSVKANAVPGAVPGAVPAPTTDVAEVLYVPFQPSFTFTTRLEAQENVELRPRISGVVEKVIFTEGSLVHQGDVLFEIDSKPFVAEVKRLESEQQAAQVALAQAQSEASRAKRLQSRNAMSAEQAEQRIFLVRQRIAELASVSAQLDTARLNLQYTHIEAPITGRISNAFVTQGNYVQAGSTVLSSLVSTDRLQAYFHVDERTWNSRFGKVRADGQTPVSLQVTGERAQLHTGYLDFIDNQVNPSTGTLRVRAVFNSQDPAVRPGAFARVSLADTHTSKQVMVPDRAIGTDLVNRFVLIVNADNTVEYRKVETGVRVGQLRVIEFGLAAGEKVVVNGPAKIQAGMTISPNLIKLETTPATRLARVSRS